MPNGSLLLLDHLAEIDQPKALSKQVQTPPKELHHRSTPQSQATATIHLDRPVNHGKSPAPQ